MLNIINGNRAFSADVTITLHAADGSVLASQTRVFPKNAQLKDNLMDLFGNDPKLLNQTGWLEIASSVDYIVGTLSFTDSGNNYLASYELSANPMSHFLLPLVAQDSIFMSGIALLNNTDYPANVQLELWGTAGTLDQSAAVTLAPHTRLSEVLDKIFPGMQPRRAGNVRVLSSQPLYSMGAIFDGALHFLAAVTPAAFPEP